MHHAPFPGLAALRRSFTNPTALAWGLGASIDCARKAYSREIDMQARWSKSFTASAGVGIGVGFMSSFSGASQRKQAGAFGLAPEGSSAPVGAHQKGNSLKARHAFSFVPARQVHQPVQPCSFSNFKGPALDHITLQREFALLQRVEGPHIVPPEIMRLAKTYRQAVRLCLKLARHRRPGLTLTDIAIACGLTRQHVTDYFHEDDKPSRRNLPPEDVHAVEEYLGNSAISQWHARGAKFTVLEELQAGRVAA